MTDAQFSPTNVPSFFPPSFPPSHSQLQPLVWGCGLGWGGYLRVSITSRDVLAKDSAGHKFGAAVKADAHVQSVGGVIVIELIVYIARHGVYWKRVLGSSVVL
jgi:hypothetical protein